jgi:hypothetical protein
MESLSAEAVDMDGSFQMSPLNIPLVNTNDI